MSRNAALRGNLIELTAVFVDAAGDPADPTDLTLSIYPPGENPELGAVVGDAWVYNVTLTDGGLGPQAIVGNTVERTAEGYYTYSFTIPADADLGSSFDRWEATLDLESLDEVFNFVIVGGGSVGTTKLYENNIVYIELSENIAGTEGSVLGEDTTYYFTTRYNPLYVSSRQVRLDIGPFITDLSDDVINFAIFEASLDANMNLFQTTSVNARYLPLAQKQYTLASAELTLIRALMGDMSLSGKMSKELGDLSYSHGGNLKALEQVATELQKKLKEWERVLQTGGDIAPGTSLRPMSGVKGSQSEDGIIVGRQWHPNSGVGDPAANTKDYLYGRKNLRTFRR